jgi:magnesium chelatase subunit D
MSSQPFPFAAIVGQHQLKRALLLCAVDPSLGGVLIRGDKGTAKSTAARALAEILPPLLRVPGCAFNCAPDALYEYCERCNSGNMTALPNAHPTAHPNPVQREAQLSSVPFVTLPLGATEDRVLGTLDLEQALKGGKRAFQPGLMAAAHRGILYIDEVNLLADHLVDALLDAAAMGVNSVQREGLSVTHPARFTLIGTMNLEEGDLRPQLLDRFGLMVEVTAPRDKVQRGEVVRRRIRFEADPAAYALQWEAPQHALREQLAAAQRLLPQVELDDALLDLISHLCCEFDVASLRADIVMHKAARASAALNARLQVTPEDVRSAAELVLPHRRRRKPFEQPGLDHEKLDELMQEAAQSNGESQADTGDSPQMGDPSDGMNNGLGRDSDASDDGRAPNHAHDGEDAQDANDACGSDLERGLGEQSNAADSADSIEQTPDSRSETTPDGSPRNAPETKPKIFAVASSGAALRHITVDAPVAKSTPGRRSAAPLAERGRVVRAVPDPQPTSLALGATLRSAAMRSPDEFKVGKSDLHQQIRVGTHANLILLVVDASGSMAAQRRMEAVKGAVLTLLTDAYQRRDQVAVIAFRGEGATLLLAPTRSVERAEQGLRALPTGGRTPLPHALQLALETLEQAGDNMAQPLLVLLTDGRANVALVDGGDPWRESLALAELLAGRGVASLVLDTEAGFLRLGRAAQLAQVLGAECLTLEALSAQSLALTIHARAQTYFEDKT